jgi:hypothetical protein
MTDKESLINVLELIGADFHHFPCKDDRNPNIKYVVAISSQTSGGSEQELELYFDANYKYILIRE